MKTKLIALLLIIMLVSCVSKSKQPTVLSNQICGKSCWNNITIGETEKEEFLKIISKLPNIDQESIVVVNDISGSFFDEKIIFQYYRIVKNKNSLINISARVKNRKIIFMTFQGNLGITFQDVADTFGEPNLVSSLWTFDGGINVHFINSLQGLEITSYFPSEKSYVSPDTDINCLSLFDPNLYQKFLESSLLTADYGDFILYPWEGYGKIEDYYWPPE